jgi:hypothetical protein
VTDRFAYPDPYYAPGWAPPPPRTDGVAVASLVTGVLGLGPVALGLGIAGLRRTRPGGLRGRGLAVAGVVLGVVGTLAWLATVAVAVVTAAATRPLAADVAAPVDAHAVQLVTGNCLGELPADGRVPRVRVVPCADAHAAQVVTSYDFGDVPWPGADAAAQRVAAACDLTDAERAEGRRMVAWSPTEASWARGDRTGLCLVVAPAPPAGAAAAGG